MGSPPGSLLPPRWLQPALSRGSTPCGTRLKSFPSRLPRSRVRLLSSLPWVALHSLVAGCRALDLFPLPTSPAPSAAGRACTSWTGPCPQPFPHHGWPGKAKDSAVPHAVPHRLARDAPGLEPSFLLHLENFCASSRACSGTNPTPYRKLPLLLPGCPAGWLACLPVNPILPPSPPDRAPCGQEQFLNFLLGPQNRHRGSPQKIFVA